ncbi:MFS transporter [Enterococcus sp. MMGLQ5-2]|nr:MULTISPECIES: MFS transporter [unclassified Enterococcus]NPD12398.1 MFS transporter [Enterococcus sp. MMGLQ5-1]NPD36844.1 MFS transporter [Enterococcus sp. MMGLQ5-2]
MSFCGVLIETAMTVTFPTLMKEFNVSTASIQWITTIYLLVIAITVPLSSYLLKKISLQSLFLFANIMFFLGLMTDFTAKSFGLLLLGRCFQGLATGIALPLMFHIILTYAPINKRGTMIGLGVLITSVAPAIGPTYGGILATTYSWHYIFLLLIPIIVFSLLIGLIAIPRQKVLSKAKLDWASMLGIILMFSGALCFLSNIEQLISLIYFLVAGLGFLIFYKASKSNEAPLIQLSLFTNKKFRFFLLGFLICQTMLLGISFIVPNYIQIVLGGTAFESGLVMIPGAVVGALLAPLSGRLLDNFGAKRPILIGIAVTIIGWGGLCLTLGKIGSIGIIIGHVFYMIGIGLCYSNLMTVGMNQLSKAYQNDGNAIFNTLQQFSGAVSTALVAVIINLVQNNGSHGIKAATTLGSQIAMLIILALMCFVFIGCWRIFTSKAD